MRLAAIFLTLVIAAANAQCLANCFTAPCRPAPSCHQHKQQPTKPDCRHSVVVSSQAEAGVDVPDLGLAVSFEAQTVAARVVETAWVNVRVWAPPGMLQAPAVLRV
jgi:hypothetical protein